MAQVKIIAPQTREAEHLRVAAYCRVSSDSKDQLHSYAAQIRSYTEEIAQHDGWELVDVYADEGLTGTRMDRREDFNRMMADCRKGKIDRILVKSVSRFARNTRDCLSALRELSTMGVSVRFEKENIDTKTLTTELMVSVSGSLAQQESISISANQKMSYQRRMERGEFITCTAPYGYRIVNKKDLEIVPEEAATVRWIFDAYLKGRSSGWIAEQLTAKGIPSQSGAECWRETGVRYLLTNEKYIGDALSQKSYSCGFPFVQKRNHGERLQYGLSTKMFFSTMLPPFILSTVLILLCCLVFPKEQLSVPEAQVTVDSCRAVIYGGLFCLAVAMVLRLVPYVLGLTVIVLALWLLDRHALKTVDWGLLATFAAFFTFSGNLARMEPVRVLFARLLSHGTMLVSALTCQIISNVPAAILLSRFTQDARALLVGVNVGGAGTLVASLASLITFREYTRRVPNGGKQFLFLFSGISFAFLTILLAAMSFLNG